MRLSRFKQTKSVRKSRCIARNNNGYIILRGAMSDSILDESVYLRVLQFERGQIQFTDATNAQKLFAEHEKEIRYNAV